MQIFWKTNISYSLIRKRIFMYQYVRSVSFSEHLAYVQNGWSQGEQLIACKHEKEEQ